MSRKGTNNARALKRDGASVDGEEPPSFRMAQVALWSVPLLWASYNIVVRQLFDIEDAPHPAILTFYRSVIAAGAFAAALGFGGSSSISLKASRWRMLTWASFELGLWNFLGTAFQVVGLEWTTATRGGFLLATCNVLVPLFAALSGQRVNPYIWLSCGMAALGAAVLSMDHAGGDVLPGVAEKLVEGDLAVLASSVFFAVATIRLEKHARENPNFLLVAGKTISMVVFALAWVLADGESWRHPIESIAGPAMKWEGDPVVWAMIAYSAVGPGGFAAWMQTIGQRQISASQAQAVYAMTPIFSAAMAPILLSDNAETLGFYGYIGGGLLVVAGLVVGLNGDSD